MSQDDQEEGAHELPVSLDQETALAQRADYVGFKHPPKATQFKPKQSGNPKGRRPGSKNHETILREILAERVVVTEGNRRRKISRLELSIRRLVEKAMKGDVKALQMILALRQAGEATGRALGYQLTEVDKHILESLALRIEDKEGGS
ncbi:DUF5681 domain-containing protein [Enterovirga rhinocerotis]|uniref:DUF5681 domain-containing protein n=1 Tax=Enterovirga rhinocerotis TaxID=1339210 RepID=A0A4V3DWF1_9HYPH|nr:DUF5681 domain-containing protein [Enterovirga rhinocerotis]TDR84489.1 hypothetical protein EV668_4934 [Enterovirga rhinocerotis]